MVYCIYMFPGGISMTILQLQVAVTTAELKSVTAAAKRLNISQPNASNCLKLLEEEIGFPIMLRTGAGSLVTKKGAQFLRHARQILEENEKILSLHSVEEEYRLHLGTVNYYTAAEPFFALCARHRDNSRADFSYCSVSVASGLEKLINRTLDIVVAPVMAHQITAVKNQCAQASIDVDSLCEIPSVISMRKDHPMARDERCRNITRGCDTMKDYPYIGLNNLAKDATSTGYNDSDFIQCSGKIFVEDTYIRLRLIEATNGFGFGICSSYLENPDRNLVSFPVPGVSLQLLCLTRQGESLRREIREYMELLKMEMDMLLH